MKTKNKKIRKTIAVASALLTLGMTATTFNASAALPPESGIVSPQYIAIYDTDQSLTLNNGILNCFAKTETSNNYYANTVVELQKLDGSYTTIRTWSDISLGYSMVNQNHTLNAKGTYRLMVTHKVYDSNLNLIESVVIYSNEVTY